MHRYLLNYSYIGTYFRGVQKNVPKSDTYVVDQSTVQGVIELALGRFNNHDPPAVSISSRTDTGVHALNTTCHFDLPKIYNCHYITVCLNSFFRKENDLIRAIRTRLVPPTFHCRFNALSRTYVYRLAILKQEYSLNNYRPTILQYFVETPIEEQNRCIFIPNPKFDVEAFRKAAKLFEGYHDFRTFMTTLSKGSPPVHTLRYIHEVSIEKSTSTSLPFNNASNYFDYWDIKFKGKSFLYRQVRRMVGVLLAVAQHRITEQDVITMLQVPSPHSWCTSVRSMPPHGLYLCDVEYRDEDLMLPLDYIEKHQNSKEIYDTANLRHIKY